MQTDNLTEQRIAESPGSAKIPLWMVMGRDGKDKPWKPYAAYGSKIQAEVYASGCSDKNRVKIVAGSFSPNAGTQRPGASDAQIANQSAPPGSLE